MEEKDIVKKSIFKQKVFAKRWIVNSYCDSYGYDGYYERSSMSSADKEEDLEFIEDKKIFECELSLPVLQLGDKFYIESLDLMVIVIDSYRTSNDTMVYYVENKIISDDKTNETYNKALETISKFYEYQEMKEFVDEVKSFHIYKKKIQKHIKSNLR
jgi:hypothetical protein